MSDKEKLQQPQQTPPREESFNNKYPIPREIKMEKTLNISGENQRNIDVPSEPPPISEKEQKE